MSFVIWLTGPSGAGKTTLANALEKRFREMDMSVEILDGDGIRSRLYPDLGFSEKERERCTTGLWQRLQKCCQITVS